MSADLASFFNEVDVSGRGFLDADQVADLCTKLCIDRHLHQFIEYFTEKSDSSDVVDVTLSDFKRAFYYILNKHAQSYDIQETFDDDEMCVTSRTDCPYEEEEKTSNNFNETDKKLRLLIAELSSHDFIQVSFEELRLVFQQLNLVDLCEADMHNIFANLSRDSNGAVNVTSFVEQLVNLYNTKSEKPFVSASASPDSSSSTCDSGKNDSGFYEIISTNEPKSMLISSHTDALFSTIVKSLSFVSRGEKMLFCDAFLNDVQHIVFGIDESRMYNACDKLFDGDENCGQSVSLLAARLRDELLAVTSGSSVAAVALALLVSATCNSGGMQMSDFDGCPRCQQLVADLTESKRRMTDLAQEADSRLESTENHYKNQISEQEQFFAVKLKQSLAEKYQLEQMLNEEKSAAAVDENRPLKFEVDKSVIASLEQDLADREAEVGELRSSLEMKQRDAERYSSIVTELRDELTRIEYMQETDSISDLHTQLTHLRQTNKTLADQNDELLSTIEQLRKQNRSRAASFSTQSPLLPSASLNRSVRDDSGMLIDDSSLRNVFDQCENISGSYLQAIEQSYIIKIDEMERDHANKVTLLEAALENERKHLRKIHDIEAKILREKLQEQAELYETRAEEYRSVMEANHRLTHDLSASTNEANVFRQQLQTVREESEAKYCDYEMRNARSEQELNALRRDCEDKQISIAALESRLNSLSEKNDHLSITISEQRDRLGAEGDAEGRVETLTNELNEVKDSFEKLMVSSERAGAEHRDEVNRIRRDLISVTQFNDLREKMKREQHLRLDSERKMREMQKLITSKMAEIERLHSSEVGDLAAERDTYEKKLSLTKELLDKQVLKYQSQMNNVLELTSLSKQLYIENCQLTQMLQNSVAAEWNVTAAGSQNANISDLVNKHISDVQISTTSAGNNTTTSTTSSSNLH